MKKSLLIIVILLVGIQFINPSKTNPKVDDALALKTSKDVEIILKRSCYDCHSFETKWPKYSYIAPFSWFVVAHVNDGRIALNFSKWEEIELDTKIKRLKRVIQTTNNLRMPLSSYLSLHEEAKLSNEDKKILHNWVNEQLEYYSNK